MSNEAEPTNSSQSRKRRVLVVEDSPVNLQLALMQLQSLGYETGSAMNGREALEELGKQAYDVILMDCQMPRMDGYEATRQIKNLRPDLPVIGVTAHAFAEERKRCLKAGMSDHVSKPVDVDVLISTIMKSTGFD